MLRLAEKIRNAYRQKYLSEKNLEKNQTFLACGIYHGLYDNDEAAIAAKKLARLVIDKNKHIYCGMLGTKAIFTALSEYGYADLLYEAVKNDTPPSYAYWVNNGLTTLAEQWDCFNGHLNDTSKNHHAFSEVDFWFYKYIAGINIDENGIIIKPHFIKGLDRVEAHHKDIKVYWDQERLTVNIPSHAKIFLSGKIYEVSVGEHTFSRI